MMTMQEYWTDVFMAAKTEEEEDFVLAAEAELYRAAEEKEIDIEAWCAEREVEYSTESLLPWVWNMCGD